MNYFCKFVAIFAKITCMNRESIQFAKILKKHGHSLTDPRKRLFKLLSSGNALSVNEIVSALSYDRSTIYRTLELFQKLGIVVEVHLGWKHKFELSDMFQHHHHHLTCVNCGKILPLKEDKELEDSIARLSNRSSFKPVDHQLEIRGFCKNCHNKH